MNAEDLSSTGGRRYRGTTIGSTLQDSMQVVIAKELPSLIDDLRELSEDDVFGFTTHPQFLTATLLGDWVFSQRPRAAQMLWTCFWRCVG